MVRSPHFGVPPPARRLSGTASRPRPRPRPLRGSTTAPAQPPPLSPGRGGLEDGGPRPAGTGGTAQRRTAGGPDATIAGGGARGHALAHSPVTGGRPASPAGLYSRPSPRCAWSSSLCFLAAATAAAAATPSPSQAQRLARRGPPAPSPQPPLTAPSHPLAGNTAFSHHKQELT